MVLVFGWVVVFSWFDVGDSLLYLLSVVSETLVLENLAFPLLTVIRLVCHAVQMEMKCSEPTSDFHCGHRNPLEQLNQLVEHPLKVCTTLLSLDAPRQLHVPD